uniref:Dynein light chain n=1 Tax=Bicosoecida sp. CB-2014 TaxID=1486930 RepID=A0A7S1GAQ8_9STRA
MAAPEAPSPATADGSPETLVQFEAPLLVGDGGGKAAAGGAGGGGTGGHIEEVLNSILPPRMWADEGAADWMQYVSKTPASRLDVINLQEALDEKLMERQAREMGICPVREDLYSQCFDELIRQVTINSPERGLLLLRVRDEIRMTIDAYKTLYESSVTFGVRKQLQAEQGLAEMESKIEELSEAKKDLQNQVLELRNKVEVIEKRATERRQLEEKKRKEEIDFLKYQGQHLDQFLKTLGGPGK